MTLRRLEPGETIPVRRGAPVVCIPVYGAPDDAIQCLRSVLEHTPDDVRVLVADDASPDPSFERWVYELDAAGALRHDLWYLRQPRNLGFVGNCNVAFEASTPGDPVVLNSDCVVSAGWLDSLRDAAYSDTRVATASALTNHGTILSVPHRNVPIPRLPQEWTVDDVAAAVRSSSLRLRPRIPTALGHCFYVRRSALELVGAFDPSFSPGYGEEVDFSQRCLLNGLSHVAADDVFVYHRGGASFTETARATQEEHERRIRARYPYYVQAVQNVEQTEVGPLPRALSASRRALQGMSVTIDARVLGPHLTGTQVVVLELIDALSRERSLRVRALVPPDLGEYARRVLEQLPNVQRVVPAQAGHVERSDVVHRPFQVSFHDDLELLRSFGERLIITHLDLIAYENPAYFPDYEHWERYRRLTRQALALADRVVFISRAAAADAVSADLVDESRFDVVYPGTDHRLEALRPEPVRPAVTADLDAPYILCIGTDYRHKNRVFALRVLEQLQRRHDWRGLLVLAGPKVPYGSSAADEAAFLAARPGVAEAVAELPAVTEAEKAWLLEHASAVLYPSLYEGFGLVPFEAAAAGVPCAFAAVSSLAEILPREAATIVPWDEAATADSLLALLEDRREELVEAVRLAGERYTWQAAARAIVPIYERAVVTPSRDGIALGEQVAALERRAAEYEARYAELREAIGEEGLSLVGPGGVLPPQMRRPLLAVAVRRWLRAPLFAMIRLPYALAYRLLHLGRAPEGSRV